jgi:hypothetical protein
MFFIQVNVPDVLGGAGASGLISCGSSLGENTKRGGKYQLL